jgi:8-oxo-dGTP pyrophosphatase MutT (NUDIX family)
VGGVVEVPNLEKIREPIASYTPVLAEEDGERQEAAVAIVLAEPAGGPTEILLIERAIRDGDPWSGQMALPGGRREPGDADLVETAVRETLEEVHLPLGEPIGRLDDMFGARGTPRQNLVVSTFVFEVELGLRDAIHAGPEVQAPVWVPIPHFLDPRSAVTYSFERESFQGRFPAVQYESYTIWGLTHRILGHFLEILGRELAHP